MRKIIIIIILIIGGYFLLNIKTDVRVKTDTDKLSYESKAKSFLSETFLIDGTLVKFKEGYGSVEDESGFNEEFYILEETAEGDINGDKKVDYVFYITRSAGVSGVFLYALAYISNPINYKTSNAIYLGDRLVPKEISIENGIVYASYLDRDQNEPFSVEPTISKTTQIIFKNGELIEK